eukprot:CAMPEP_0183394718 /NCGR_PEP_ID=MMETSP0370-20130417/8792_1 /TAXON_ID=268820 /ORGANISM="Peridinium aciculiferum, Strain PAER-2" /LENGTH=318 /DNA_ID=CAMNT_0025575183 /DNA_START=143 /DNA_END=1095 /DNA_ORIENTATION=+
MVADAAGFGMATPEVVLKVEVSGCFYRVPVSAPASLEDAEKALHSLHLTRHGVLCEADAGWRNLTPESWAGALAVVSARLAAAASATDISVARRPVVVRLRAAAHAVAAAAEGTARATEAAVVGLEAPPTTSPECPSASPASHAVAPPPTAAQQLPEPSAPPPTPEEPAAPVGEPEQFDMAAEDSSDEEGDLDSNGRGPQLISVGAMLEAVSSVVVREHEMLCEGSPILRRLPAGAQVQVLRLGSDPGGRRVFVRDDYGIEGWASVVSMEGGRLLRPTRSRGQSDRPEGAGQPQGATIRNLHALLRERHDLSRAEVAA